MPDHPAGIFKRMSVVYGALFCRFCYFFSSAEIFGLRICVLIDDLEATLVLGFPFSGRILMLTLTCRC